jgi:aspartyl-tRNA synthetase
MTFIDLRDRYGITQLVADDQSSADLRELVGGLGREYVIQAVGMVRERSSKNKNIPTGEVEVELMSSGFLVRLRFLLLPFRTTPTEVMTSG